MLAGKKSSDDGFFLLSAKSSRGTRKRRKKEEEEKINKHAQLKWKKTLFLRIKQVRKYFSSALNPRVY